MRTVRYTEFGGPEVLTLVEVDDPTPGPGQVRLRTEAVAGSFVDTVLRAGAGPFGPGPLPASPHGEVVGTVEAVGPDVESPAVGRRVAAAGSIGHLAVQLARLRGARRVIGLVGSAAKRAAVTSLGAEAVSLDGDWPAEVRALAPDGLSVVIDSVGGEVSTTSLDLLAPFGRMVVYGAAGGSLPSVPAYSLMAGMRTVTGFGFLQYRAARPDEYRAQTAALVGWLATGALRVWTQETVPLAEAPRAHELLEDRSRVGRVLVAP